MMSATVKEASQCALDGGLVERVPLEVILNRANVDETPKKKKITI